MIFFPFLLQNYHSMDYHCTEEYIHFSYPYFLKTKKFFFFAYIILYLQLCFPYIFLHTSTLQSNRTITFTQQRRPSLNFTNRTIVTNSASSIKFYPKHEEWSRWYYATALHEFAQIFNSDHKRIFVSSSIKSNILSLAFSLKVNNS